MNINTILLGIVILLTVISGYIIYVLTPRR